ncbi:MAG: ABC transporter permease [Armatimonadota bacterium]|nr:ABC transporter permease [Armatimonadota bacterium]MDR7422197.1 ABC transporter permease [Armatimonadota bacterium]MDR7457695.1 ABC transporter permease [Armatimonadota bacterium]MDR7495780.1 ABC transporter permease [Armatimonadota bacterium]MDR7510812.1 ABC transporter permease [Armatimonadota bacterium]
MTAYIARRLLHLAPVLLIVSAIVFFVFRIIPGDQAVLRLGEEADAESVARLRRELGLDRPLAIQYAAWLGAALRADLGESHLNRQGVFSLVVEKFPATLQIAVLGMAGSLMISVPVGILAALHRGTWWDQLTRAAALVGFSVPRYWLAVLLILVFAVRWRVLPPAGFAPFGEAPLASLRFAALPVLVVALSLAAVQMRFLRASMLEVIDQDYIRTARAKGLSGRVVVFRHALKNALIPFVTVLGLEFGSLLGGLVVVEQIFNWPGVGWLMVQSIVHRDYAVVQGAVLLVATGFVTINLLVDVAYAALDPRIRYS